VAHHKRKRPKNRRAGCLYCKPYKANGTGKEKDPPRERRKMQSESRSDELRSDLVRGET
jgi:hypothetical protein